MVKKAPLWGKAIGIIMISLGGLGLFYQFYKLIIPLFFKSFLSNIPDVPNVQHNPVGREVFDNVIGTTSGTNMLLIFGILGIFLIAFYIIGGVKLLSPKPENYNFAKYMLLLFIAYNLIEALVILTTNTGMITKILLIYSGIGFIFDLVLVIILQSSNKADYGIGVNPEMQTYTLNPDSEEVF